MRAFGMAEGGKGGSNPCGASPLKRLRLVITGGSLGFIFRAFWPRALLPQLEVLLRPGFLSIVPTRPECATRLNQVGAGFGGFGGSRISFSSQRASRALNSKP